MRPRRGLFSARPPGLLSFRPRSAAQRPELWRRQTMQPSCFLPEIHACAVSDSQINSSPESFDAFGRRRMQARTGNDESAPPSLVNVAGLLADIIHQQILAEGIGSGEIGLAAAKFGNFLDEVHQAVVAGEHESVDQNPGSLALRDFLERLRDYQRIQAEGVLVNAPVFQRQRGRLAVSD